MNVALSVKPDSAEDIIARAQALIPSLRERAARIAEERKIPDDVMNDLKDAGLIGLQRPIRYGGDERSPDLLCRVGRELAKGDGATSWVYLVTAALDSFISLFPESVQAEYWNSESPTGASGFAPSGSAKIVDGGFVLNGKWSFCSGVDHAGWVLLGGIVGMLENSNRPDMRYFLLKRDQFNIIDDWYLSGLRGTGSKTVEVVDAFVPAERMIHFHQTSQGRGWTIEAKDHPEYSESLWIAIGFAQIAQATSIAKRAYEAVISDLKARMKRGDPAFAARRAIIHAHIGEVSGLLESSDLLFERATAKTFEKMASFVRLTDRERAEYRRDMCFSVQLALQATEKLMAIAGSSGLKDGHPAQRALRDLYAVASHPGTNWDSPSSSFGSVELDGGITEFTV